MRLDMPFARLGQCRQESPAASVAKSARPCCAATGPAGSSKPIIYGRTFLLRRAVDILILILSVSPLHVG